MTPEAMRITTEKHLTMKLRLVGGSLTDLARSAG
jgi:hypothetical protein